MVEISLEFLEQRLEEEKQKIQHFTEMKGRVDAELIKATVAVQVFEGLIKELNQDVVKKENTNMKKEENN